MSNHEPGYTTGLFCGLVAGAVVQELGSWRATAALVVFVAIFEVHYRWARRSKS